MVPFCRSLCLFFLSGYKNTANIRWDCGSTKNDLARYCLAPSGKISFFRMAKTMLLHLQICAWSYKYYPYIQVTLKCLDFFSYSRKKSFHWPPRKKKTVRGCVQLLNAVNGAEEEEQRDNINKMSSPFLTDILPSLALEVRMKSSSIPTYSRLQLFTFRATNPFEIFGPSCFEVTVWRRVTFNYILR